MSAAPTDLPVDVKALDEKRKAEHIARCGAVFGPLRKLICRMGHPL